MDASDPSPSGIARGPVTTTFLVVLAAGAIAEHEGVPDARDAGREVAETVQYFMAESSIARRSAAKSTGPSRTWTIRICSKTCGGGSSRCCPITRTW
jgi:hypothetical protein